MTTKWEKQNAATIGSAVEIAIEMNYTRPTLIVGVLMCLSFASTSASFAFKHAPRLPDWLAEMRAEDLAAEAETKLIHGDPKGAIDLCDEAIWNWPKCVYGHTIRGFAKIDLKDRSALVDFDQNVKLCPESDDAFENRGWGREMLGDLDGAKADYSRAIALNNTSSDHFFKRASVKESPESLADYDECIRLDPKNGPAYARRQWLLLDLKDWRGAASDCTQAIVLGEEDYSLYKNRAYCRLILRDYKSALSDANTAFTLTNNGAKCGNDEERRYLSSLRAWALSGLGDHKAALEIFEQIIQAVGTGDNGVLRYRVEERFAVGDLLGAATDYGTMKYNDFTGKVERCFGIEKRLWQSLNLPWYGKSK